MMQYISLLIKLLYYIIVIQGNICFFTNNNDLLYGYLDLSIFYAITIHNYLPGNSL